MVLPNAHSWFKGMHLLTWGLWEWGKRWSLLLRRTQQYTPLWLHLQGTEAEAIYHVGGPSYGSVNAKVIALSGVGPFIGIMNGAGRLSAQSLLPFVSVNARHKASARYSLRLAPILGGTLRTASGLFDLSRCHLWLSGFTTWANGQKSPC